jgi:hypothetical protein
MKLTFAAALESASGTFATFYGPGMESDYECGAGLSGRRPPTRVSHSRRACHSAKLWPRCSNPPLTGVWLVIHSHASKVPA